MAADDVGPMLDYAGAAEPPALEYRARQALDAGGDGTYLMAPDSHDLRVGLSAAEGKSKWRTGVS